MRVYPRPATNVLLKPTPLGQIDNPRSGAVLIKAGFLYTGEIKRRTSPARGGQAVDSRMMVWLA